jgi:hypothetical protein
MPATPRGVTDRDRTPRAAHAKAHGAGTGGAARPSSAACARSARPAPVSASLWATPAAWPAARDSMHRCPSASLPEGVPMPLTQTQLTSSLTAPRSLTPRPPGDRRARGDYAQGARQRPEAEDRRPGAADRARQTVARRARPATRQPTRRARSRPSQRVRARPLTKATAALPSVQKARRRLAAPTVSHSPGP